MLVSLIALTKVTSQLVHGGCRLVHITWSHKVQRVHLPEIIVLHQALPLGRTH